MGYDTINIGDVIQSFVTSTLVDPDYVIVRDNYDEIYKFKTGKKLDMIDYLEKRVYFLWGKVNYETQF